MRRLGRAVFLVLLAMPLLAASSAPPIPLNFERLAKMPMPIPFEDTAVRDWLAKPVLESRLLDDMETSATWSHHGLGNMTFTRERARDGRQSVRIEAPTKTGKHPGGRPFGEAVARRDFKGEDWTRFNRLSFWVYPRLPGFKVISMSVRLGNDGAVKLPNHDLREGLNFFLLKPDTWNHIVWEIPYLARDKVSGVEFVYRLQGNEPGAAETVRYDIDHLELQRVEPDYCEGWNVAPGKIAYSHSGYLPDSRKTALASGLAAREFELIDIATSRPILRNPIQRYLTAKSSPFDSLQILDFSEARTPGQYILRASNVRTRPFRIGEDCWRDSILKTINFFYCERCGTPIAGIHDACHHDWRVVHPDGRTLPIYGGWHDAGDLSQGCVNTAESAYAMLDLAEHMGERDPALRKRVLEEARWGIEWLLKTRFGDGYRASWATMDFWTDGKVGTVDDADSRANNSPHDNFLAAAAEAAAARLFKSLDPKFATSCTAAARDDWRFAVERTRKDSLEIIAAGAFASVALYKTTRDQAFADKAFELADLILASQQQSPPRWGFFFTGPDKHRLLHYSHRSHEQQPIVALVELCETFPTNPRGNAWRTGVQCSIDYLKSHAGNSGPWQMLAASIYSTDERYPEQIRNGVKLDERYYLRFFPVWTSFRGNNGVLLSQAKALSAAARLLGDREAADLARLQLEWVVGRNPFCESLMYGEGHHYAPQYTAMSGDMVGSLPVGIETQFDKDVPYWPAQNCYNYKEVWVHPSARWLMLMRDLAY